LDVEKIYSRKEEQEEYARTLQEVEKEMLAGLEMLTDLDLEALLEHIHFLPRRAVPEWIRKWAEEFEKDGVTLEEAIEEARRISRKFKTPLSEEVIAEREERR